MDKNNNSNAFQKAVKQLKNVLGQKSNHLLFELKNDPKGGFFWWLQTHSQKLELDIALEKLRQDARKPGFKLDSVTKTLAQFKVRKDDLGHAQWYQDAHDQLENCLKALASVSILKPKMIKPAMTDLRYISEADDFHQYFQLQPLQRRVQDMYEALTDRLDVLLAETKLQTQEHKKEIDIRKNEAEAKLENEKTLQKEAEALKETEALKIIEAERALIDHQKDAEDAAWTREEADRKLRIEESQQQHRVEIQESFGDMQLGIEEERPRVKASIGSDGLIDVSATQHMEALLRQINNNELDRGDPKVKEQLQALLQAIAGL